MGKILLLPIDECAADPAEAAHNARPPDPLAHQIAPCVAGDPEATAALLRAVGPALLRAVRAVLGPLHPELEDVRWPTATKRVLSLEKILQFHANHVVSIYEKLKAVPEGAGTMADSLLVQWMSDGGGEHHNGNRWRQRQAHLAPDAGANSLHQELRRLPRPDGPVGEHQMHCPNDNVG